MKNLYICLDIEATGLNAETEDIIEIAAVKYDLNGNTHGQFHTLIHTDIQISSTIENLTGINNQMLHKAPKLEEVKQDLKDFCEDLPIMGHNIQFDTGFLRTKGIDLSGIEIDTLPLSQAILKEEKSFSLEVLCQKYNQNHLPSHRALDDVLANIELFSFLNKRLNQLPSSNLNLLLSILDKSNSDKAHLYKDLLQKPEQDLQFKFEEQFPTPSNQKLLVTNTDLLTPTLKSTHTILPSPYTEFNQAKLLSVLQEINSEFIDQNLDLVFNLSCKINNQQLTTNNLNTKHSIPKEIKNCLNKQYVFNQSTQPYLCNYKTFFYLNNLNLLENFTEIEIKNDPYLVEGYLQNQEIKINIDYIDNLESEEINLYRIFDQLQTLLIDNLQDQNHQYKFLVLDMFQKASPEFQENIKTLHSITNNDSTKASLEELISNHTNLYIWLEQYKDYPVQIKAISKNTSINEQEILSHIDHQNIIRSQSNQTSHTKIVHDSHDTDVRTQQFTNYIIHHLKNNLSNISHTALVISPTKHIIKHIHENLSLHFKEQGINLLSQDISGSKGKIIQLLETNESPSILVCTNHFLLKFQPELANLEKAILTKLPIGLPAHKIYRILEKENDNSFNDLLIPQTAATIRHILNLLSEKYNCQELVTLDNRMINTGWGKKIFTLI